MRPWRQFVGLMMLSALQAWGSTITGRVEEIQGKRAIAARTLVKSVVENDFARFRVHAEGFLEVDGLENIPYSDKGRVRSVLEEGYLETDISSVTLKLGLQPVRWSESWTMPSLDFWTARRFDRYFLDPLPEDLKNPLGLLARYSSTNFELEGFASFRSSQNSLPLGIGEIDEKWGIEGGVRTKLRFSGFDFSPVYARNHATDQYGFMLSYAFQVLVPKIEIGHAQGSPFFAIVGTDIFLDNWSILPQYTLYRVVDSQKFSHLGYLPVRLDVGKNSFELQFLLNSNQELFWGVEARRSLSETFSIAVFVQDYVGSSTGYISSFNEVVESSPVVGFRLTGTTGF